MNPEKIQLVMENGKAIEAVVFSKRADAIEVVLGEGISNVKCTLTPTRNGLAYAGSGMGRNCAVKCGKCVNGCVPSWGGATPLNLT